MNSHEPRTLGYYASSHWFQGAVLFVIIGLLAIRLLSALNDVKEQAEKQGVDLTIRHMQTGMLIAMTEVLYQQQGNEIASWVGSNPVRWLVLPPTGYRGECSSAERQDMSGGQWCFEKSSQQLVYRPSSTRHLQMVPERTGGQCEDLSWRVVRVPEAATKGGFAGLRLESSSPCQWVPESG